MSKKNPFASWQTDKVKTRAEFIEGALIELNQGSFKTVSCLAEYVSKLLTQHEKNMIAIENAKNMVDIHSTELKPVSKSTLLRNKTYRALLDAFMSGRRRTLGELASEDNVPELKIAKLQMALSLAKSEKRRLEKHIEQIEKERMGAVTSNCENIKHELEDVKRCSDMVAQAFVNLYGSEPLMMILGLENGNIVDYSGNNRVIVESKLIQSITLRLKEIEMRKSKDGRMI